jgi:hypothetical protein
MLEGVWLGVVAFLVFAGVIFGVSFTDPRMPVGDWVLRILAAFFLGAAVWMYAWLQ